jgi:hypothetical protein
MFYPLLVIHWLRCFHCFTSTSFTRYD